MSTTWSLPDPPTEDEESLASTPRRGSPHRLTRSRTPTSPRRKSILLRGDSPAKQTFELDVGDAISPKRIRVTVEAEPEHHHNNYATQRPSSSDSGGRLSPSPYYSTPFRRSAMKVKTTTVPLRGLSDSEGDAPVATPARERGRPKKSIGTPIPSKARPTSTPAAKMTPGTTTRRLSDLLGGSSGDNSEEWDFNVPQHVTINRGRSESHSRAAPYSAVPAESERASSEVPMSSRANKRGRRMGMQDGTPSAFGQLYKKPKIGQSRLGRLDFDAQSRRSAELRRSSESIVEPEADDGFGPFDDSSRPSTRESGNGRVMGSSPPNLGGSLAYPALTSSQRNARERRQSIGYQEFSFAVHDDEDYGQSSSIGSTGAAPVDQSTKPPSPPRTESPAQHSEDQWIEPPAQAQRAASLLDNRQPTESPQVDAAFKQSESPQQQYYDQDSRSSSPAPPRRTASPPTHQESTQSPPRNESPLREDSPEQQYYNQESHSSSLAASTGSTGATSVPTAAQPPSPPQAGSPAQQSDDEDVLDDNDWSLTQPRKEIPRSPIPTQTQPPTSISPPTGRLPSESAVATTQDSPLRGGAAQSQSYDQASHPPSPALSQHHSSTHSRHSAEVDVPFPSLSPVHQQVRAVSQSLPQHGTNATVDAKAEGENNENEAFNEFDTIMENEDFTMITAETVPSLLQYFTSPLDPVEQAEIRQEIADEEAELEEADRREEKRQQRKMRVSGFQDIVHQTVERSMSREVEVESEGVEELDWSLTQPRRQIPRSPPQTQEPVEQISGDDQEERGEEEQDWNAIHQPGKEIPLSPPQRQEPVEQISEDDQEEKEEEVRDWSAINQPGKEIPLSPPQTQEHDESQAPGHSMLATSIDGMPDEMPSMLGDASVIIRERRALEAEATMITAETVPSSLQYSTSTLGPVEQAENQPEPPTPVFKRSLQRSQVEIELEEVLQKARKRRSGLPDEWMRQSLGSAMGNSMRSSHAAFYQSYVQNQSQDLDQSQAGDDSQAPGHSMLGTSIDGTADERPSMLGDASMMRRERRAQEAEERKQEQEREAERIRELAASKEAERQRKREERELERRKRAEELERELAREREEREAKRESERQKRREERERLRDEEINREREERYKAKLREEEEKKQMEEAQAKCDAEKRESEARREAELKAQRELERQAEVDRIAREATLKAQVEAERQAELEGERLMVEAKRAAEREAERVVELRKEREAAKQRRRLERQAELEAEETRIAAEREAQRQSERQQDQDKENVRLETERATKRARFESRATHIERPQSKEPEMQQPSQHERLPFGRIPTTAHRIEHRVFDHGQEKMSTSYALAPLNVSHKENDDSENPFRLSGQGKRTFEPRDVLVEKPQSAAAMPKPDFLFNPPSRYAAPKPAAGSFEFDPTTQPHLKAFAVAENSRVRGGKGSMNEFFGRAAQPIATMEKEPEMEQVRPFQPPMLKRVMKSVEVDPPYSDGLRTRSASEDEDVEQSEVEAEDNPFLDAEKSVSVSVERSQSRSASRSASMEESASRSVSRSASRSTSGSVTPKAELTGLYDAIQNPVEYSSSEESQQQDAESGSEDGENDDVDVAVDAKMEDAPSVSASRSSSLQSQQCASSQSSSDSKADQDENDQQSVEVSLDEDEDVIDEDEDPFSRFSDSENEIVASTPMPPRGLAPTMRQPKRSSQPQVQPESPARPHQRRARPQISDDEGSENDEQSQEQVGNSQNQISESEEDVEEEKHGQDRRSTSLPHSGYRTAVAAPKSPLKSSLRHPPPLGSPKKAVVFSATTALSPDSSFEETGDSVRGGRKAEAERDMLDEEGSDEEDDDEESRSPSRSVSGSPTPSIDSQNQQFENGDEDDEVEMEAETEVEDRSHLHPMTPYDWSKPHWKTLLSLKNQYESSPTTHAIPDWVQDSPFVSETIWGAEPDGSMDLVVEPWMVYIASLFITSMSSPNNGSEDWSAQMEHVLKRVYGLVSVERKCASEGKIAPWETAAREFQPVRKRTVERLDSEGRWVEVKEKERKGFFGLGLGWL